MLNLIKETGGEMADPSKKNEPLLQVSAALESIEEHLDYVSERIRFNKQQLLEAIARAARAQGLVDETTQLVAELRRRSMYAMNTSAAGEVRMDSKSVDN